jgi:hypothetical protein
MKNHGTVAGRLLAHGRNTHSGRPALAHGPKGRRGPARPMRWGMPRCGHHALVGGLGAPVLAA